LVRGSEEGASDKKEKRIDVNDNKVKTGDGEALDERPTLFNQIGCV
jgi:hypothetical protein